MTTGTDSRVFVLGLDGVPWSMLREWAAAGELDNFATLFEEGAAGPLESTTPATTPLAWPSIAAGTRPDKHGIYGFRRLTPAYAQEVNTANEVARPLLWDQLSPAVVANVPMTYPATELDGAMVTGMMTPRKDEGFTYPPELREEIAAEIPGYRVGLNWRDYDGATGAFAAAFESLVEDRRALMRLLMEREDWRLFFFVYTAPDRLQHHVWAPDVLLDHYRQLDDVLGEVLAYVADRDATLLVVSDHGFGPISKHVAVNRLLADEGLLVPREPSGLRAVLERIGVTKDGVLGLLERVGLDEETLVEHLPEGVTARVASRIPGEYVMYDVDFGETVAFVHELGNVYVNDTQRFERGTVDPSDVPAVKRDLAALFSEVTDPETGERALTVHDGDALFPTDPDAPDLVVAGADGYGITTRLADDPFVDAETKVAGHRPEGVFLAWGPDVEPGATPAGATVFDVAPTALHAAGEPIPEGTDGEVLEIFAAGSRPAREEPRTVPCEGSGGAADTDDDFGDVEDRLRGLGYID